MVEHQGGFSQEQLVIYKLGQIESQLSALVVKLTENHQAIKTDLTAAEMRIGRLEESDQKKNIERAKVAGFTGAIVLILSFFKGAAEKWLGLSFLN
jgi:hypothetical protein